MIFGKHTPDKSNNTYSYFDCRDVLIGAVKSKSQFYSSRDNNFYHIPSFMVADHPYPIRYVALYQSIRLWGMDAGIRYYGEVESIENVHRSEIEEIRSESDEEYIRFNIKEWKKLIRPIKISENMMYICEFTNLFLLTHSSDATQLTLQSKSDYELSQLLINSINDFRINDLDTKFGFEFGGYDFEMHNGNINIYKNNKRIVSFSSADYIAKPATVLKSIKHVLEL